MNDEIFFAWLDGELDESEAANVAALVAADPALSAKAEAHRAMQAKLSAAFAPIASSPVPQSLRDSARPASNVVDFAAARERRRGLPSAVQWAAMAATLAIGLFTGTMIQRNPAASGPKDALVASASLGETLDQRLAGDPQSGDARVGLSFRDRSGAICRTFTNARSQGLACRQGESWAVRALVPAGEGQQGEIRMAAGPDPALAAIVDRSIAGEPFDATQEKAARDAGWR